MALTVAGRAPWLIPRGEFSIAIAGLTAASTVEEDLGVLTVAYVILTVVVGSVVTKVLARRVDRWDPSDAAARHGLDESDLLDRLSGYPVGERRKPI